MECGRVVQIALGSLLAACGASTKANDGDVGDGDSDGDTDSDSDVDGDRPGCRYPEVFCEEAPPRCGPDEYPVAEPCPQGFCPGRCWTGECAPCEAECDTTNQCAVLSRFGCCCDLGDMVRVTGEGRDGCEFDWGSPPSMPDFCVAECVECPEGYSCYHCPPHGARCEGGTCVAVWPACEPDCGCD